MKNLFNSKAQHVKTTKLTKFENLIIKKEALKSVKGGEEAIIIEEFDIN